MARDSLRDELYAAGQNAAMGHHKNEITATFLASLDDNLGECIIDGTFGERFQPKDAPLYVAKRRSSAQASAVTPEFGCEEQLHRCYWPDSASKAPLLILQGGEGMGKTTLLRFYFDCYLPNYDQFQPTQWQGHDPEQWQTAYSRHVVLYADLRRGLTGSVVVPMMCASFRDQILRRFPNITVENDYAMWARRARWQSNYHVDAERAYPDRHTYRAAFIGDWIKDDRVFVEEALWYLGSLVDHEDERKYYLTLICDNLDQQDPSTQLEVIDAILRWLGDGVYVAPAGATGLHSGLRVWKVLLPLRPETLRVLEPRLRPIVTPEIVMQLGEVDEALVIEARAKGTAQSIRESGQQVDIDRLIDEDQVQVYAPVPNFIAAESMRRILTLRLGEPTPHDSMALGLRRPTADLLADLCSGSLRRYLMLQRRLAMSFSTEQVTKLARAQQSDLFITDYAALNGLLSGGRMRCDGSDQESGILNLYDTASHSVASAYTLLVGVHILHLLLTRHWTAHELTSALCSVGYSRTEVHESLTSMRREGLLKYGPVDAEGDYSIHGEIRILRSYAKLVSRPAYTDNMATVTPVEDDIRRRMTLTVADVPGEFVRRVNTSLAFLQQIRDDELTLCRWSRESARHTMEPEAFKESLAGLALPSACRRAAFEYRRRLDSLAKMPGRLGSVIEHSEWQALLNHDLLSVTETRAVTPLKPVT